MVAQGSIFAGLDSEGIGRLDSRTDIVVVPVEIGSRDYGGFAGVFVYYFYGRDFHRLALNYIQVAVGTSGVFDSEVKVDIGEVVFVVASVSASNGSANSIIERILFITVIWRRWLISF